MATDWRAFAAQAAADAGYDPAMFVAQIGAESGFNPSARSPVGATGIAQIMPGTAKAWGVNLYDNDPSDDIRAAARNMAAYYRQYGNYEDALEAYNAGGGNVIRGKGIKYNETRNYVAKILGTAGKSGGVQVTASAPVVTAAAGGVAPSGVTLDDATIRRLGQWRAQSDAAMAQGKTLDLPADIVAKINQARAAQASAQPAATTAVASPPSGASAVQLASSSGDAYAWSHALAKQSGLSTPSTYRSPAENARVGGSKTSAHMTLGAATDFAGSPAAMRAFALWAIEQAKQGVFKEVFYDPVGQWDNGRFSPQGIGGHSDHVHITR